MYHVNCTSVFCVVFVCFVISTTAWCGFQPFVGDSHQSSEEMDISDFLSISSAVIDKALACSSCGSRQPLSKCWPETSTWKAITALQALYVHPILIHRRRRWPNITPTLHHRLLFSLYRSFYRCVDVGPGHQTSPSNQSNVWTRHPVICHSQIINS